MTRWAHPPDSGSLARCALLSAHAPQPLSRVLVTSHLLVFDLSLISFRTETGRWAVHLLIFPLSTLHIDLTVFPRRGVPPVTSLVLVDSPHDSPDCKPRARCHLCYSVSLLSEEQASAQPCGVCPAHSLSCPCSGPVGQPRGSVQLWGLRSHC